MPNADTEGRVLIKMIEEFVSRHPGLAVVHTSLGQQKYYSCMSHAGAVIGNSSSGLTEAPRFRKATINIGDRQHGRLQAKSVVNCAPQKSEILNAFEEIFTSSFQDSLEDVRNPNGEGGASEKILRVIREFPLKDIVKKRFNDIQTLE